MQENNKNIFLETDLNNVGKYFNLDEAAANFMQKPILSQPKPLQTSQPVLPKLDFQEEYDMKFNNLLNNLSNTRESFVNPELQASEIGFHTGTKHTNRERYKTHPLYAKFGFEPFRDNETLYNDNSTWFQEMQRATPQFFKLWGAAIGDAWSFGKQVDTEMGEKFDEAMAIGMSQKGGVGGFTTNLFLNSAYTFGIMSTIVAEEVAAFGATALTGGAATPVAIATTARNIKKVGKIYDAFDLMVKFSKSLNKVDNVSATRNLWQKTANFVNPFENTTSAVQAIRGLDKTQNYTAFGKIWKTGGGLYRDVRQTRLAWGESGLEGGMIENESEEALYNSFVKENRRNPTKEESLELKRIAHEAGRFTALHNLPTIFLTNKLTFNGLFKMASPTARLANKVSTNSADVIFSSKLNAFKSVNKSFINTIKNPKIIARRGLGYFEANLGEGIQELAQESINTMAKSYYLDIDNTGTKGRYLDSMMSGLKSQWSPQGLETFLSGFLMGGMVNVVTGPVKKSFDLATTKVRGKEYAEAVQEQKRKHQEKIELVNQLLANKSNKLDEHVNRLVEATELDLDLDASIATDDIKDYISIKDDIILKQFMAAADLGVLDDVIDSYTGIRNLTVEEKRDMFNLDENADASFIDSQIETLEKRLGLFKDVYATRPSNPFNPTTFPKDTPEHNIELKNYIAFEQIRKLHVQNKFQLERLVQRNTSLLEKAANNTTIANLSYSDVKSIFGIANMADAVNMLTTNLKVLESAENIETPELKTQIEKDKAKLKRLESIREAYEDVMSFQSELEKLKESDLEKYEAMSAKEKKEIAQKETEKKAKLVSKAYKVFEDYMTSLAKEANKPFVKEGMYELFEDVYDYFANEIDVTAHRINLDVIADPQTNENLRNELLRLQSLVDDNRKAVIQKHLDNFIQKETEERLVKELSNNGYFFNVDELDTFKKGKLPERFYYKKDNTEVPVSEVLSKIIPLIKPYVEGIISNIPIAEAQVNTLADAKGRLKNDKRTLEDLSTQYDFNLEDERIYTSREILEKVLQSDNTLSHVSDVAELILTNSSGISISFTRLSKPYSVSQDGNLIEIDPRYVSEEYKRNKTVENQSFENIAVKAILQAFVEKNIQANTEVAKKIQDLQTQVAEALSDPDFVRNITKVLNNKNVSFKSDYSALNDTSEFLAAAITDISFATILAHVQDKNAINKSAWESILEQIINIIEAVFDIAAKQGSVLNSAVDTLGKMFGAEQTEISQDSKEVSVAPKESYLQIDITTPVQTMPEDLQDLLVLSFKRYNTELQTMNIPGFVEGLNKLSSADILVLPEFKSFIASDFNGDVSSIINDYVLKNPIVEVVETTEVSEEVASEDVEEFDSEVNLIDSYKATLANLRSQQEQNEKEDPKLNEQIKTIEEIIKNLSEDSEYDSNEDLVSENSNKIEELLTQEFDVIPKSETEPSHYIINGKKYQRQSDYAREGETLTSNTNMLAGAAVGNLMDIVGRDIFSGVSGKTFESYLKELEENAKNTGEKYIIENNENTRQGYESLVKYFTELKESLSNKGFKFYSDGVLVYDDFNASKRKSSGYTGVAGVLDLVAIDPSGNVHILDFKNVKASPSGISSTNSTDENSKYTKWGIQQSLYAQLAENMGVPITSISAIPFMSTYDYEGDKRSGITIKTLSFKPITEQFNEDNPLLGELISSIHPFVISVQNNTEQKERLKKDVQIESAAQSTDTKAEIEAKKADIERRRKELESSREIEMLYDLRKPITEDSKETISKINEANRLREQAKNKSDQAQKETDEDTRIALNSEAQSLNEKAQIVDKEIKASRDNVIESTPIKQAISSAKILGQRLLTKIKLASKSNEWVSSMPISKEDFIKLEDATKRLSVKNMGEVTSNSEVIPDILLVEEINAKYDAELKALNESQSTQPETKVTEKLEPKVKQSTLEKKILTQIKNAKSLVQLQNIEKLIDTLDSSSINIDLIKTELYNKQSFTSIVATTTDLNLGDNVMITGREELFEYTGKKGNKYVFTSMIDSSNSVIFNKGEVESNIASIMTKGVEIKGPELNSEELENVIANTSPDLANELADKYRDVDVESFDSEASFDDIEDC